MSNDRSKPAGAPPGEDDDHTTRRPAPRPGSATRLPRPLLPNALVGSRSSQPASPGETGVRMRLPAPPGMPRPPAPSRPDAPRPRPARPEPKNEPRSPALSSEPPISIEELPFQVHAESDAPGDSLPPPSLPDESGPHRQVGRCELFAELAHGGMATVHLGRWIGAGGFVKTVAVKALHKQFARDPEFVRMFLDEAQVVARIRHPNVMPTIDLVEERGDLFIVMEFVESATFSELLKRMRRHRKTAPIGVVLRILSGVLHGLHAAHEARDAKGRPMGVIHRDVSPENILVGTDGYGRLIDFGIARALGRHASTRDGHVKGKLGYLAPEQVTGDPLDRRTDVYSASVVLWQALTGKKLFRANTIAEVTHKILYADIVPPSRIVPALGRRFDAVVMRGLAREPDERWQSAEEMAEALEALGGLASHREVGAWVRETAARRLERVQKLVKAVENAPLPDDPSELDRPLSIHPAPEGAAAGVGTLSMDDESQTDATGAATASAEAFDWRAAARRPAVLVGAGAVLLLALIVGIVASGDAPDETAAPSAEPSAPLAPASHAVAPPTTAEPSAAPSTESGAAPSAEPSTEPSAAPSAEPSAEPSAKPRERPKRRWRRPNRQLPYDI